MPARSGRLDMVRLFFAGLVLLSHASEFIDGDRSREPLTRVFGTLSFGEVAVAGFFVLSGYLITQSWERSPDLVAYLRKRAARLYPGFIVASILAVFVVGRIAAVHPASYYADLDPWLFTSRLLTFKPPVSPPVFAGAPYPILNSAMWTIQYELMCYVLVAALGVFGVLKDRRLVSLLWASAVAIVLAQRVTVGGLHGPAVLYGPLAEPLRCLMLFTTGMMFAAFGFHRRGGTGTAIAAGAVLLGGLCVPLLAEPVLAAAGGYLLLRFGCEGAGKRYRLPDLSYGAYLYGAPVEMLLIRFRPGIQPWAVFACAVPLSLLLGLASWRWIEEPALRRWSARRAAVASRLLTATA